MVRYQKVAHKIVTELGWELNAKGGLVGHGQRHTLLGAVVNYKPNICGEYYRDVRSYLRLIARGRRPHTELGDHPAGGELAPGIAVRLGLVKNCPMRAAIAVPKST